MKRRLRNDKCILVAWPDLLPTNHAGAVRGKALANAVERIGWNPLMITPRNERSAQLTSPSEHVELMTLYDSYASRYPPPLALFALPLTVWRLVSLARSNRVVAAISSTPAPFVALETSLMAAILGIPFLFDVRDAWTLEEITHRGFFRFKRWLEGRLCRRASRVWAVTQSLAKMLVRTHRLPSEKVKVVPNGADLSRFRALNGPRLFDLVFLGAPSLYRDVPSLLKAFDALVSLRGSVKILWLGWREAPLPPGAAALLKDLIRRGSLKLSPPVPHDSVPDALAMSKVGVVSLSGESVFQTAIGAKTYEYLATGLPLLCLGPPGESELRQLVESQRVGFFTVTPEEFAKRGIELISDPDLSSALARNCQRVASKHDRGMILRTALLRDLDGTGAPETEGKATPRRVYPD